jgi:hypothetical protein
VEYCRDQRFERLSEKITYIEKTNGKGGQEKKPGHFYCWEMSGAVKRLKIHVAT